MVDSMASVSGTLGPVRVSYKCIWAGGIGINADIIYYCSPTPLRTSARHYLRYSRLAAIATAGLSTTIYAIMESACFASWPAASSALLRSCLAF